MNEREYNGPIRKVNISRQERTVILTILCSDEYEAMLFADAISKDFEDGRLDLSITFSGPINREGYID
jgi:hypothetical protein